MKGAVLDVYVLDTLVGHLVDDFDQYVFTYLHGVPEDYLVSLTMPVRAESYVWKRGLFPFFMQNLPEGFQKQVIRERLGPHADVSDWGMLALTGRMPIGRVRVVPAGMPLSTNDVHLDMSAVLASEDSQSVLLKHLNDGVLEGISGVMPKAMHETDKATLWTDDYILKTGTEDIPGLAINEYLCLEVARNAGLDVPKTVLSEDGKVLAVARFDRRDGQPVAVEDFCSLSALDPVHKYKGSIEEITHLHTAYVSARNRQRSARQLYRLMLLNYALHNGDAHLKNYALVYTHPDDAVLAPVYDLVTTSAYPAMDDMPALTLQGRKVWWAGKQMRLLASNRMTLTAAEKDEAQAAIIAAIDATLPLLGEMAERYPYFRETAKRMAIEWESGKLDIQENARKRLQKDKTILEKLKLSDEANPKKAPRSYANPAGGFSHKER
ncbi:serine/threonine-protein kinase HipA [Formivibrio citricus]|uniref:Serine/threonine-protein kinase HipA n=1 Tax=Formivibrio citricus TaxID=83765 RepID=A0A1I5CW24_9NEIS|nr:type II toxin-antitoxin system HipA family toxin [Formivibrio citricus]SFN90831.1 serine/threonine-protein kinase HipA [Formivibrio citricus]